MSASRRQHSDSAHTYGMRNNTAAKIIATIIVLVLAFIYADSARGTVRQGGGESPTGVELVNRMARQCGLLTRGGKEVK